MKHRSADVLSMHPVVTRTPAGWLAVSAPGSPIRIGTTGSTREQARQSFATETAAWAALVEIRTSDVDLAGDLPGFSLNAEGADQ